jgi:hypothetical protein
MAHLTVVDGAVKPPFAMNSHDVAQYKLASRYATCRIVESYADWSRRRPEESSAEG